MKYKCNYCETMMLTRLYGDDEIKCNGCGTKYVKEIIVVVREK